MKSSACFRLRLTILFISVTLLSLFNVQHAEAGIRVKKHVKSEKWTNGVIALDYMEGGITINEGYSNITSGSISANLVRGAASSTSMTTQNVWNDNGKFEFLDFLTEGHGSRTESTVQTWLNPESGGTSTTTVTGSDSINGDASSGPTTVSIGPASWPKANNWIMRKQTLPGSATTNYMASSTSCGPGGCSGCCCNQCGGGSSTPQGWPQLEWTSARPITEKVEIELVAHGTNVANNVTYLLHVTANNLLTGQPVPPGSITVLGQAPDASGFLIVEVPEGSTNDVTPVIQGIDFDADHYIGYAVAEASAKLEIHRLNRSGDDGLPLNLTDRHWTNWTGERVLATAQTEGQSLWGQAGYSVGITNTQWTVAQHPATFGNYDPGATNNQLTPGFPLNMGGINFCWLQAASSRTLAAGATITITGPGVNISKSASASCTFEVKKPEGTTLDGTIQGEPSIGPINNEWRTILLFDYEGTRNGFRAEATFPTNSGSWGFCQRIDQSKTFGQGSSTVIVVSTVTNSHDGGIFPFRGIISVSTSGSTNIWYEDSPSSTLSPLWQRVQRVDDFSVWLMFVPTGGDSCWVPVRKMQWSWGGRGMWSSSLQMIVHDPSLVIKNDGESQETNEHPTWVGAVPPPPPYVPTTENPW